MIRLKRRIAFIAAAVLMTASCAYGGEKKKNPDQEPESVSFFAMDTYMTVKVSGGDMDKALAAAQNRTLELEELWSVTDGNSEIYKLNRSEGEPMEVSEETAELLDFALDMWEKTDGALDVTMYPLVLEWGFTSGEYKVPPQERIEELLENTGAGKIKLENRTVTLPEGMSVDLGSVGKGRAGDCIIEILRENGVTSAMLDLGGNVQLLGAKPDGSLWRVGVRDPFGTGTFGILSLKDKAVITSGGYERFFVEDGITYWHILDPKTGGPARSGLASVTIVGDEGRLCDALSTSIFVMGLEKGEGLWRSREDFDFIAVTDQGEIYITEGIENSFSLSSGYSGEAKVSVIKR